MTLYISIALVFLLSIGVLGVHEIIDLFSNKSECTNLSRRMTHVHFNVFYPTTPSPAVGNLINNINLDTVKNLDDSTFSGTIIPYCNFEKCTLDMDLSNISKTGKRPVLGIRETAADWIEDSRMSVYPQMKLKEVELGILKEDHQKLRIAIIIANKLPYYELEFYLKERENKMNESMKHKFLYLPHLGAALKKQWKYNYYVIIATNNIIHQYAEFHRRTDIMSKAIIVQLDKVKDDPLALAYRIARSNTCRLYYKAYQEYIFPLASEWYYHYMLSSKEVNHPAWRFIPIFHIVGVYRAEEPEFTFLHELLYRGKMSEYMNTVRRSFPTAQFQFTLFLKTKVGYYAATTGELDLSPEGYVSRIKEENPLIKSRQPYIKYHDHFSINYVKALYTMKHNKYPTVVKPFYFLITDKIPNSLANLGNFKKGDTHYYHTTLKKRVPEVDGEIMLLRTDRPREIVPEVPKVSDVITEVKQNYLAVYDFPEIIESMTSFARYIMRKNEDLILNIPNVSTRNEWSPVEYPGIPAVMKHIQVAIVRWKSYPTEYGTLYAHVMGRRGYSLQQMLAAYYNVHIEKITTTYISDIESKKLTKDLCESDVNAYVKERFLDDIYDYTGWNYVRDWVGFVYGCFTKIAWHPKNRVAVIFENDLKHEMINPAGSVNSAATLNIKRIFVVKTTNIKYNPSELQKQGVYIIQANQCSNLLTCVSALIADIFGNFVPFNYV